MALFFSCFWDGKIKIPIGARWARAGTSDSVWLEKETPNLAHAGPFCELMEISAAAAPLNEATLLKLNQGTERMHARTAMPGCSWYFFLLARLELAGAQKDPFVCRPGLSVGLISAVGCQLLIHMLSS